MLQRIPGLLAFGPSGDTPMAPARSPTVSPSLVLPAPPARPGLLRNVLDFLGDGVAGDILYRAATGWTRLAKGADGSALVLASGLPSWGAAGGSYAGIDAPRVLNITSTGTTAADLANIDYVVFNTAGAGTLQTFSNVVVGKIYKCLNFGAGNWTIDRTAAYLNGSANQVLTTHDMVLLLGRTSTTVVQAAPISVNG